MKSRLDSLVRPLLWLVLFTMLPQFQLRPLWSTLFVIVLLGYRFWIDVYGGRMPPRFALIVVHFAVGTSVWAHYHSFLGDEAGGALLTLLTCMKVYELKAKRDFFFTCMLCLLVLMSYLLLDQGLLITGFLVVDVVLVFSFLHLLETEVREANILKSFLRPSFLLALKALPFLVLIFLLFPRFSTNFGTGSSGVGSTGVSDSLHPGSLGKLIPSNELVFRAAFLGGDVPRLSSLYWRGAVLDISKGLDWERSSNADRSSPPAAFVDRADVEIYLEPGSDRFLFSLEGTGGIVFPNDVGRARVLTRDGEIFELNQPLQTRERYYIEGQNARRDQDADLQKYLQTDESPSKEMKAFLKKIEGKSPSESIRNLLSVYNTGGYVYSLQPPKVSGIDEFLFKTKSGFCEHYAGSMATILRQLKIPSRVVVGFQGGTASFLDNYVSVRGHDAHAWVEYFDQSAKRWRRIDPTMEVAPERLLLGSDSYLSVNQALRPSWLPANWSRVYFRSRAFVDEVEASWIGFLLRFDLARQRELLAKLGMEDSLFRALPVFLLLAIALILAILYFIEARRREPISLDEKFYRQLLKVLQSWKIHKAPNEGPLALLAKVRSAQPGLVPFVEPILDPLVLARFGGRPLTAQVIETLRHRLKLLKKQRSAAKSR